MRAIRSVVAAALLAVLSASVAPAQDEPRELLMFEGMHERISFDKNFVSVAIGNDEVLEKYEPDNRHVVLRGLEVGRTSLIVDFEDGTSERVLVLVQRDLSVLQRALKEIHPGIVVTAAPDREAVVLTGTVPDVGYSVAAQDAAAQYLRAGRSKTQATGVYVAASDGQQPGPTVSISGDIQEITRAVGRSEVEVINLLRLETLPPGIEERMMDALRAMDAGDVKVRRLVVGELPNARDDAMILEGSVRDQVQLVRVLQTMARMVLGRDLQAEDVKVIADEAGGLTEAKNSGFSGSSQGSGFQSRGFGGSGSGGIGGSSSAATDLGNRVGANLGRATSVSVAEGRILSFIAVEDLPQIRVNIRLYEVDRNDLLTYAPEFAVLYSDFSQPSLNAGTVASSVQGSGAARVGSFGGDDVQNVFGFLANGFTQQFQLSGSNLAIDAAFNILESHSLARRLSSPSLTVLSGEQALFLVGGEVPIEETFTADNTGTFTSVFFKQFGVQLGVRPLVGQDDVITLDLVSQVSEPDPQLTTVLRVTTGQSQASTAFELRAIGTSARLEDGQALVIGGLASNRSDDSSSATPWIADWPVVGWLFKRFNMSDRNQDLVVVVSPVIVREPLPDVALWEFPDATELLDGFRADPTDSANSP